MLNKSEFINSIYLIRTQNNPTRQAAEEMMMFLHDKYHNEPSYFERDIQGIFLDALYRAKMSFDIVNPDPVGEAKKAQDVIQGQIEGVLEFFNCVYEEEQCH